MKSVRLSVMAAALAAVMLPLSPIKAEIFPLDTVAVGNPGNLPDHLTGLGSVGYS